jgi:hypothetical protein
LGAERGFAKCGEYNAVGGRNRDLLSEEHSTLNNRLDVFLPLILLTAQTKVPVSDE